MCWARRMVAEVYAWDNAYEERHLLVVRPYQAAS